MGEVEGLILLFGVLAMLQLKHWSARGRSNYPVFMGIIYHSFLAYQPNR